MAAGDPIRIKRTTRRATAKQARYYSPLSFTILKLPFTPTSSSSLNLYVTVYMAVLLFNCLAFYSSGFT